MATNKSCACLSLHKSARIIGTVLFLITVGLFVAYLIFIEDLRRSVVEVRKYLYVLLLRFTTKVKIFTHLCMYLPSRW